MNDLEFLAIPNSDKNHYREFDEWEVWDFEALRGRAKALVQSQKIACEVNFSGIHSVRERRNVREAIKDEDSGMYGCWRWGHSWEALHMS